MAELWKIGQNKWINPAHIVTVTDYPAGPEVDRIIAVDTTYKEEHLRLLGEEREQLLAYLARETESAPPPAPA